MQTRPNFFYTLAILCSILAELNFYQSLISGRESVGGFLYYQCNLGLDTEVLKEKNGVAYKYCVVNSQHDDPYEYLHGLFSPFSGVRNRWLRFEAGALYGKLACG